VSKDFYAILGCHSSGSSALAGSLYHLGVDLGEHLWGMYGSAPIYGGEDYELSKILEAILPLPNTYTDYTQKQLLDIFTIYLSRRYKHQKGPIAAKYPTLAVFGDTLLGLLEDKLKVIFCDRDIDKSILSLHKRYPDVDLDKISNLQRFIYHSATSLLEKLPEDRKIIVNYEDTCAKPEETIKRVAEFMKLNPTEAQLKAAVGHIDIKQKHI